MNGKTLPVSVIGYSGHAYVVIDALLLMGRDVAAYCDAEEKVQNPFNLRYLGREKDALSDLLQYDYFASVGDNRIRRKIVDVVEQGLQRPPLSVLHPSCILAASSIIGAGVLVAAGAVVNPLAVVGKGTICNTGSIVEHECLVGEYVHIAPGAVLCGNVTVGDNTFIGANTVIKQGIIIGENVVIGAGSVVTRDVPAGTQIMGNPAR